MHLIADLQLHSKYSRAVSPKMTIPFIASWAKKKGIDLVATGDWTHPMWIREIQANLEEMGNGLLKIKNKEQKTKSEDLIFLLATEVSSIYSQGGKLRRVHTLIWVPTIASAEKINAELKKRGCNLMADGRPIIGLSCIQLAELVLSIEPKSLLIPAHAWTPWFSVYGSLGGFNSLDDAFGSYSKYIYAIETGLSSNPAMNWRIKELDSRSIVSFSDAHSGPKLGREATVFDLQDISYDSIYEAVSQLPNAQRPDQKLRTHNRISYTLEFYPEEGKYHYTGHRNCNVKFSPEETKTKGTFCPVCKKKLTEGVMQRIEQLAGRNEKSLRLSAHSSRQIDSKMRVIGSKTFPNRPPFVMLVPLQEIIAEAFEVSTGSKKVQAMYDNLVNELRGEFSVLLRSSIEDIARIAGEKIADGVSKVRTGDIVIDPGYDGVFGRVTIWKEEEKIDTVKSTKIQLSLF